MRHRLGVLLLVICGYLQLLQTASAQQATYKLIAPELVAQGESFSGTVVEETDKGDAPLNEGDRVVFQGQVVPVEQHGKVKLPPILQEVAGGVFAVQIMRASSTSPESSQPVHIAVAPSNPNVQTKIAQTSSITAPHAHFSITGQQLGRLQQSALRGANNNEIPLDPPLAFSSFQRIYTVPEGLPKGTYRFVARDASGNTYEAPNQCTIPTLTITGDRIRHRGQRGQITVTSDIEGTATLSGGEPIIRLDVKVIDVHPNVPARVQFTAQQPGDYKVDVTLVPPKETPVPPGAPHLNIKLDALHTVYHSSRNETAVTAPLRLVDERGQPAANVSVDVALAHPNGLEYGRVITDSSGQANFLQTLPGQLAVSALSVHVFHVPGQAWTPKRDGDPCCQVLGIEIQVAGTTEGSKETEDWLDKLKEALQKAGGAGAEAIGDAGSKIILGYRIVASLTRPWEIYATLGKGVCEGEKCQVKEKVKCRLIPRDKNGKKVGMPGGVGGSENEAWPPRIPSQKDWWDEVGQQALARALANIVKYCACDDGKAIWPPPDATPVPGCK